MAFVPPVFSKFGRACSDLLTKKWELKKDDFKNQVAIKSKSQGITITSTVIQEDDAAKKLSGKVNVKYDDKNFGEVTAEVGTAGAFKGTFKASKLRPGFVVSAENTLTSGSCTGKVSAEYAVEPAALTVEFDSKNNTVNTSAAVGFEGFSVGASATVDPKKLNSADKKDAVSVEGGVQYEDGNLVGTFKVEKNYKLSLSLFHSVSSKIQLAAKALLDSKAEANVVTVGGQYKFSDATSGKAKADIRGTQDYTVSTFIEHSLADPKAVIGLSHEFASDNSAPRFAVNVSLGN